MTTSGVCKYCKGEGCVKCEKTGWSNQPLLTPRWWRPQKWKSAQPWYEKKPTKRELNDPTQQKLFNE